MSCGTTPTRCRGSGRRGPGEPDRPCSRRRVLREHDHQGSERSAQHHLHPGRHGCQHRQPGPVRAGALRRHRGWLRADQPDRSSGCRGVAVQVEGCDGLQPVVASVREDGITVAGLPVLVSDQMDSNTLFWGIPEQHVMFVQRKDTTVERFPLSSRTARTSVPSRGSAWPSSTRPAWSAARRRLDE